MMPIRVPILVGHYHPLHTAGLLA